MRICANKPTRACWCELRAGTDPRGMIGFARGVSSHVLTDRSRGVSSLVVTDRCRAGASFSRTVLVQVWDPCSHGLRSCCSHGPLSCRCGPRADTGPRTRGKSRPSPSRTSSTDSRLATRCVPLPGSWDFQQERLGPQQAKVVWPSKVNWAITSSTNSRVAGWRSTSPPPLH